MTYQTVTLNIPGAIYQQIERAAKRIRRPVTDVLVEVISAAAPAMEPGRPELRATLAQMAYLNDAALWQAARSTLPREQSERLASLHDAQQRRRLTSKESAEEQALLALYQDTILVRGQAAVLLKQRGYDIADLSQFAALE